MRGWFGRGSGLFISLEGRSERTYLTDSDNEDGLGDTEKQIEEPSQCLNTVDEMQEPYSKEEEA